MDIVKFLRYTGFEQGVNDYDDKNLDLSLTASTSEYGSIYWDGYREGYKTAATKSWYIVALNKAKWRKSYLIDLKSAGTDWTYDKEKATKLRSRAAATSRLNQFGENRVFYKVAWE